MSPRWPFAEGGHEVHDSGGVVVMSRFELDAAQGIQRSQVVEENLLAGNLRVLVVDQLDLQESEVTLRVLWRPDLTGNRVACSQIETPDLGRRNINVVGTGQVVRVRGSQKTKAVRQDLQNAFPVNQPVSFRVGLQQGKDEILLVHAGGALDGEIPGHGRQFIDLHFLEFNKIHTEFSVPRIRRCGAGERGALGIRCLFLSAFANGRCPA